jgi:hypothetical protein
MEVRLGRIHVTAAIRGAAVLLAISASALAQPPERAVDQAYKALDPRNREIVETYLRTDCEIGEVGAALRAVLQIGPTVKPYLTAVAREGPPSPVLATFGNGVDETWEARQQFLKTPDALELGRRSFEMMSAITKSQYLKDQEDGIQAKYRERAALALKYMR